MVAFTALRSRKSSSGMRMLSRYQTIGSSPVQPRLQPGVMQAATLPTQARKPLQPTLRIRRQSSGVQNDEWGDDDGSSPYGSKPVG